MKNYVDDLGVNIEPEFVAELIASEEVAELKEKFGKDIYNEFTGASSDINVNIKDIESVVEKAFNLYEKHTGEAVDNVIDRSKFETEAKKFFDEYLTDYKRISEQSNSSDAAVVEVLKILKTWLSLSFYLKCLGFTLVFALLIIVINRDDLIWIKYISLPLFIVGVLIFISACILKGSAKESGLLYDFEGLTAFCKACGNYLLSILSQMKGSGIVSAVLGYAALTFEFIFKKKKVSEE